MRNALLSLTLLLFLQETSFARSCIRTALSAFQSQTRFGSIALTPDLKLKLLDAHKKWLKRKVRTLEDVENFPGTLRVDQIHELGSGWEGTVYSVLREGRTETVKIFHENLRFKADVMENSRNKLRRLHEAGIPTPEIYQYKLAEGYILMEYVEGFAVDKVLDGNFMKSLGVLLTDNEKAEIGRAYSDFEKACQKAASSTWAPRDYNVLIDLIHDRLVVIDPH